jgi:hypothetical protein
MNRFSRVTVGVLASVAALAGVLGPIEASTASAAQKCIAKKLKVAAREAFAKMVCYEKAKMAATTVDSTCLMRAQSNVDAAINRTTGCPGDATSIDAAVDSCLGPFLTDDPGNGACPAGSAEAIGRGAKGDLVCQAKEITTPGTFTTCDTSEDGKTTARLGKAGGGTPCLNVTSVMADIDNCNAAIDALVTCGPCDPSCGDSLFAPATVGLCTAFHLGSGDVCVDSGSCSASSFSCGSDSDCPSGQVCVVEGFDSPSRCCSVTSARCTCPLPGPCPLVTKWGSAGSGGGQFEGPEGVALDPSGNVFVADFNNNRIQEFTSTGTFLLTFGWGVQDGTAAFETCTSGCQAGIAGSGDGQFDDPWRIAVDGSGNVFVAGFNNNRIQKFTNTGTFLTKWGSSGNGDGQFNGGPLTLAVDGNGSVFVTDGGNNRIQEFTNSGAFLLTLGWGVQDGAAAFETCTSGCQAGIAGSGDGQFSGPGGVAVDANGNLFVADSSRIQKFDNAGNFITKWAVAYGPGALAVDASGNVFASYAVSLLDDVAEYTNTGALVRTWGCTGSVGGIAVDGSENVFVTDARNNRIQKFGCP